MSPRHPRARRVQFELYRPTAVAHGFHGGVFSLCDDHHHVISSGIKEANKTVGGAAELFILGGDEKLEETVGD